MLQVVPSAVLRLVEIPQVRRVIGVANVLSVVSLGLRRSPLDATDLGPVHAGAFGKFPGFPGGALAPENPGANEGRARACVTLVPEGSATADCLSARLVTGMRPAE